MMPPDCAPARPIPPARLTAWDWLAAFLLSAAALVFYIRTLIPTLLLGDGAEFQVLGHTLGLAHPTGYPVYLLMVKLVTLLAPVGDIAYRSNLSSAVYAVLTLGLLFLAARLLGAHPLAALAGPLALGASTFFWWHAVMAEVYTAATFMISLVLFLVLFAGVKRGSEDAWTRGRSAALFWAGVAGGLSPGVHGTAALIAPAVGIYLLLLSLRFRSLGVVRLVKAVWLPAAGGAVLGALLFLGAFAALDRNNPPSNDLLASARYNLDVWGIDPVEFDSSFLTRFRYQTSGLMFREVMWQTDPDLVAGQWRGYREELPRQFSPWFIALAGLGVAALLLRGSSGWREAVFLAASWGALTAFVLTYQIGDIFVFYIPTYVPAALAASLGAGGVAHVVSRLSGRLGPAPRRAGPFLAGAAALALVWVCLQPALPLLRAAWTEKRITFLDESDLRWYPYPVEDPEYPRRYARSVVDAVEDDAIIITTWDLLYPIFYVAHIEQGRLGINAFETYRSLIDINPSDMTLDYIRSNIGVRPVYVTKIYDNMQDGFRFSRVPGIELWRVVGVK